MVIHELFMLSLKLSGKDEIWRNSLFRFGMMSRELYSSDCIWLHTLAVHFERKAKNKNMP